LHIFTFVRGEFLRNTINSLLCVSLSLSLCPSLSVAVVDAPTRSSPRYSRRCIIPLRTILLNITEATCFNILYLPSNVRAIPFRELLGLRRNG